MPSDDEGERAEPDENAVEPHEERQRRSSSAIGVPQSGHMPSV